MRKGINQKSKTKILLIFATILLSCWTNKVHAISFDPYTWYDKQIGTTSYTTIGANQTLSFDLDLTYFGDTQDDITLKYGLLNAWNGASGSKGTTYNFIVSVCSGGGSLTGFANANNSLVKTVNSGLSCNIAGYSSEYIYYFVKLTPNVYNIGNSTKYSVTWNSTLNFTNAYNYGIFFRVASVDIYTDSEFTSLLNDASDSAKLNEQINEIKETNSKLDTQISQNETIIDQNQQQIEQDKVQHDEFMNSDISEEDKKLPDDSKYQDYTDTEDNLKYKVNQADMSVISIGIDANSSNWVWNTLTSIIQTHSVIFGMFIAILSIGIIKLALGR